MTRKGAQVRLVTLGGVHVSGGPPGASGRLEAQPKRLAVLAFLAARPPGEGIPKDRILVTFWPDLATERAQANLRNTLYFLRKNLGAEALVTRGQVVSVAPDRLSCDAADLLGSPGGAPPEGLLHLYRGDFLDAMHLRDSPDFERWVDRMRAALRRRVEDLAWDLSDEAEDRGEWITAARYARRATELAVDVEAASQRLIRLLDRAGDRAAAVAEYERLTSDLRSDFGVPPSPETVALIDDIRGRTAVRDRPSAVAPTAENRWSGPHYGSLAVLPFENLGGPDANGLASGLVSELLTTLATLRGVRVLSRTSVRAVTARADASMREIHAALGADLVLEGSIRAHADRVRVAAHLVDARDDVQLWAETYERPLTDVFAVQSDVAIRVARALEVQLSPSEHRRLRSAPTRNPEAYRRYLLGRDAWAGRNPSDAARAIGFFEEALDLDEDLAPAWAGLADAHLVLAHTGASALTDAARAAREALDRALELDPTSGEARAALGLSLLFVACDPIGSGRELRRAVDLSPSYATARQWYGQWLASFGKPDDALGQLEHAVALDGLSPAVCEGMGLVHYFDGRTDAAETWLRQTLELDPRYRRAHLGLALCRWQRGDREGAARAYLRAHSEGLYGGLREEAEEAASRASDDEAIGLEYLLQCVRGRLRSLPMARIGELILLALLDRSESVGRSLHAARREGLAGFAIQYAPLFDAASSDATFRAVMEDLGMWLPRWEALRD